MGLCSPVDLGNVVNKVKCISLLQNLEPSLCDKQCQSQEGMRVSAFPKPQNSFHDFLKAAFLGLGIRGTLFRKSCSMMGGPGSMYVK